MAGLRILYVQSGFMTIARSCPGWNTCNGFTDVTTNDLPSQGPEVRRITFLGFGVSILLVSHTRPLKVPVKITGFYNRDSPGNDPLRQVIQ